MGSFSYIHVTRTSAHQSHGSDPGPPTRGWTSHPHADGSWSSVLVMPRAWMEILDLAAVARGELDPADAGTDGRVFEAARQWADLCNQPEVIYWLDRADILARWHATSAARSDVEGILGTRYDAWGTDAEAVIRALGELWLRLWRMRRAGRNAKISA